MRDTFANRELCCDSRDFGSFFSPAFGNFMKEMFHGNDGSAQVSVCSFRKLVTGARLVKSNSLRYSTSFISIVSWMTFRILGCCLICIFYCANRSCQHQKWFWFQCFRLNTKFCGAIFLVFYCCFCIFKQLILIVHKNAKKTRNVGHPGALFRLFPSAHWLYSCSVSK